MITSENIALLQHTVLFQGSSREDLELALSLFFERRIEAGVVICAEKTPADALYIIKSGSIRITLMAGDEEKKLLLLGPRDFFGELSLIHEADRQVSARAEKVTELLVLSRKDFQELMELDPRTGSRLLLMITKLLAARVRIFSGKVRELLLT